MCDVAAMGAGGERGRGGRAALKLQIDAVSNILFFDYYMQRLVFCKVS